MLEYRKIHVHYLYENLTQEKNLSKEKNCIYTGKISENKLADKKKND